MGVVRAFANGAKRPKSPLHGACQPFAYGEFELSQRRDTYIVTLAQAQGVFFDGLAAVLSRLALAGYFGALCSELAPSEEPAPTHLRLLMNALHFLSEGLRPQWLLKAVVELRLMCLSGLAPLVQESDSRQQTSDAVYLDCVNGTLAAGAGFGRVLLSESVLEAVRFICNAPLERAFRFSLPEESLRALSYVAQTYVYHQTGRRFDELGYWEKLVLNEK